MSAQDFTAVIGCLAQAQKGLSEQVDDNRASPRHVLITALQNENQRLSAIDPDTLTIFQSAHTLTHGLCLIQTADAFQRGVIDGETVAKALTHGRISPTKH